MSEFEAANFGEAVPPQSAGEVYIADGVVTLPDTLAADDIIKFGHLPADCLPVDLVVHTEELDSNATDTLRITIGLLNDAGDDIVSGSELLVGAQAEAVKTIRANGGTGFLGITRDKTKDRILAAKVTTAAATAASGKLRAIMTYRASNQGV